MKPIHGKIMMGTGIVHSAIAAPLIYWDQWGQFFGKYLFNVSPHTLSENSSIVFSDITSQAAIWFFVGGILFFFIGQMMHFLELHQSKLPAFVGWELLAIGVLFAWMLPQSGFTFIVIPQAVFILIRSKKQA